MRYFKNKFFIICLTVALCLTVFSVVLSATGNSWFLKDAFNVIATPFRSLFNACADGITGFVDYFTEYDRLVAENDELRKQNAELNGLKADLEAMKAENEWLREFLDVKNHNVSFEFEEAVVIGKTSGASNRTFTLNKGSMHGIESNMVVINENGLVGRITEVGLTSCEVLCIIDVSSAVGACVERSALVGILEGYYEDGCRFSYTTGITNFEDIVEGDTIITSGKGSIYPYGLRLGKVKSLTIDEASRSVIATIETAVDFDDVDRVMIIRSFTID